MDLNTLWFILVGVLFAGFFFLEGFDYGVGTLLPFLGKKDVERRLLIHSIGPFWDGNEVWMITAGGAIFAAFPIWYSTLFSGFYLALFLLLLALIFRGVGFEFRSKDDNPLWRKSWDMGIWFGSFLPAILWGVAVANLLKGVPIDQNLQFVGDFGSLFSPYTVVSGIAFLALFAFHGALFLTLRLEGELLEKAKRITKPLGFAALVAVVAMAVLIAVETDLFTKGISVAILAVSALALIGAVFFTLKKNFKFAFISTAATIITCTAAVFTALYPRVMVSSLNPDWSLTIYNASATTNSLQVMTIVAVCLVPVILIYQAWSYHIFRKRINEKNLEY